VQSLQPKDPTAGVEPTATAITAMVKPFDKKVLIVLPFYKSVHPITAMCVSQLLDRRRTATMLHFGDAFVTHSRNTCADFFLQSNLEWALWLDDDMVVPFGNAQWYKVYTGWKEYPEPFASFNALDRLLSHGKTIVGGLYRGRHNGAGAVYNEGANPGPERDYAFAGPYDLIKPTRWVGTGCMLTHRSVFEDIEKRFPHLGRKENGRGGNWFTSSEHQAMDFIVKTRDMLADGPMTGEKAHAALTMMEAALHDAKANSGLGFGEDVQFCVRALQAGHQPFVDMGLFVGHIGHRVFGPAKYQV